MKSEGADTQEAEMANLDFALHVGNFFGRDPAAGTRGTRGTVVFRRLSIEGFAVVS